MVSERGPRLACILDWRRGFSFAKCFVKYNVILVDARSYVFIHRGVIVIVLLPRKST